MTPRLFAPLTSAEAEAPTPWRAGRAARARDCALAGLLLALTAPVIAAAALLVRLTSRGPAFYSQARVGLRGRSFTIYKLRTMTYNCEAATGARWSGPDDPRVTRVGRWLRRTHIDELPQLWNVLRGEMGLVGPRPERPEFVARLELLIPDYAGRLAVRPGVTGLAQVQLPPDTDLDSVRRKLRFDLYYLRHARPGLDLRILAATAVHVLGLPFAVSRLLLGVPGAAQVEPQTVGAPGVPRGARLGEEPAIG